MEIILLAILVGFLWGKSSKSSGHKIISYKPEHPRNPPSGGSNVSKP